MSLKCALIVDDSPTAQRALGKVLAANSLRVETADSAEEALEFLSRTRPDVIFMDHNMPGMDGLQAVRAIKNNPATATIPVMMYTAQEGELYVGQARALGAVGVLPKQIKPVEVSEILRSLRLIDMPEPCPETPASPPEAATGQAQAEGAASAESDAGELTELHRFLQELFQQHRQEVRTEIEAGVTRALREQAVIAREEAIPILKEALPRGSPLTAALMLGLAGVAGVFFWLHLDTQRKWQAAVEENSALVAALKSNQSAASAAAADSNRKRRVEREQASGRFTDFIETLEWGVNQSSAYAPDAEPFGAARLETIKGLLDRLDELGFAGTVRLDSHVGDFCYVSGPSGALALAPDDLPAERCERVGLPVTEARAASARESVAFANFLNTRATDAAVQIELVSHGNTAPAVPYPPGAAGLTAGEWNAVARQNNRVTVTLLPGASASTP